MPQCGGERGSQKNFSLIGILKFMLFRSPYKDLKPYNNPFWDFITTARRKRGIIPKIVLVARTSLRPIKNIPPPATFSKTTV
jgi:hypothetical protein